MHCSGLNFEVFYYKTLALPERGEGFKSEFGFDTDAAISRFVAKRMSELLSPSPLSRRV